MENCKHWYLFAFSGQDIESGSQCQASTYTGFPRKEITLADINEQKQNAGVTSTAVSIAINYLGYMSRDTFVNGFEVENLTDLEGE